MTPDPEQRLPRELLKERYTPLGTVRLRYPRVADQHWRLQNDRFCDT